jgi:ribonuclease T2
VPEIERAFALANPGLRPDMMAVTCRKGMLEEVRLCLTRDLRGFRSCDEVSRDVCRTRDIIVPAAR